ncbi:MAG TPA: hypothetical protein VEF34_17225 [Syntrophobacteraceae bacterium]|nr:hypothetical protein [Syntrophobacteraceae bacterium]
MLVPDEAKLNVVLRSGHHTIAEARMVIDALDGLVMAGVWGGIMSENPDIGSFLSRNILNDDRKRLKAHSRFSSGNQRRQIDKVEDATILFLSSSPPEDLRDFDPYDPMHAAVRDGVNCYLRRLLFQRLPKLYESLFSFATLTNAEHHSPLLIELSIFLGILSLPVVLTYGLAKAAVAIRKANAEADIRETEANIRKEELSQKKLQTMILQHLESAVSELKPEHIPKEAIAVAAQLSTTSIADLSSKPLIGSVSLGITTKS